MEHVYLTALVAVLLSACSFLLSGIVQCSNYSKGLVAGSLCEPLCKTKEIQFTKCLGAHALKLYVFEAEWKGKPVIIKSVRPYPQHRDRIWYLRKLRPKGYDPTRLPLPVKIDKSMKLTREEFIKQANATLFHGIAGGRHSESTERVLWQVVSDCDLQGDGLLHHDEIVRCWEIVESEEYMIASLLQGNPGVSEVYGVCGRLFAEEFATPLDSDLYLGSKSVLSSQRSWEFQVKLVLAILDLLDAIEDTPYGTLYYCDVKEANIGVVKRNGQYVAKAIDLDSGWFGDSVSVLKFQKKVFDNYCEADSECDFVACHFACNSTSHTCSDRVISNNFQVRAATFTV